MQKTVFNSPGYTPEELNFEMDELRQDETKQPIDPRSYPFEKKSTTVQSKRKELSKMNDTKR